MARFATGFRMWVVTERIRTGSQEPRGFAV